MMVYSSIHTKMYHIPKEHNYQNLAPHISYLHWSCFCFQCSTFLCHEPHCSCSFTLQIGWLQRDSGRSRL